MRPKAILMPDLFYNVKRRELRGLDRGMCLIEKSEVNNGSFLSSRG
jgi:hypothetical protein